jgi:hypothetical protein
VNGGTDLSVITSAGTTVSGGFRGINARNYGTGALTVTVNGDVTSDSFEASLPTAKARRSLSRSARPAA